MTENKYIKTLKGSLDKIQIGNKAESLLFLQSHNYRVPESFIVTADAFDNYLDNREATRKSLAGDISDLPSYIYIVRSSTNLEDSENYSHAGQFLSIPDIDKKGLIEAICTIWDSVISGEQTDYSEKANADSIKVRCAVIIQKMINPVMSGVSFSKNPVTGSNEVVIEAVEGSGEDLMQKGLDPLRWRIRKSSILEGNREYRNIDLIKKIAISTSRLKSKYGRHIDIEWVFDGSELYYLQLRSVTVEEHLDVFSNKMAQEMLPGQITPLVWSVNIDMVNGAWIDILSRITGPLDVKPHDLAKPFYYRTYFNVYVLGKILAEFGVKVESLENTMLHDGEASHSFKPGPRTLKHTFRIIRFINYLLKFEKFFIKEFNYLDSEYKSISERLDNNFSLEKVDDFFDELMSKGKRLAHLNIIMPLLMRIYNKRFSKKVAKLKVDYNHIDFHPDFPELKSLSPLEHIEGMHEMIQKLSPELKEKCRTYKSISEQQETGHIVEEFKKFIADFGHHSESGNDFSHPKWEEDYEFVFKMISEYSVPPENKDRIVFSDIRYSGLRYPRLRKSYYKAGRYKIHRERISSLFIFGVGMFRKLFHNVADEFVNKNIIDERDDIFYLSKPEIMDIITNEEKMETGSVKEKILRRKTEMKESESLLLPAVIYGHDAPILDGDKIKNFRGVSTSTGVYRGVARIVRKKADFETVRKGDIVIIPFSDVSWTPVLSKAGAIVAESGGILSHCSIIAREMGIPALVSVENACGIKNNTRLTVDGSNGILTIHDYE